MSILGPIISAIVPSLLGGLLGGGSGQAASAGASSSANAQAQMINMLMDQYKSTFGPAQKDIMNQYMGLSGSIPTQDIVTSQIINDLLPTFMPEILRAQTMQGIQGQGDRQMLSLQTDLAKRGIQGPAAEALMNRIREGTMQSQAQAQTGIGTWEAQQTLSNQRNAYTDALQMLGLAGQYSQIGSAMPGTAIQGAGQLTNQLMQAGQNAAAPWGQVGNALGTAFQNYYATPQQSQAGGYTSYVPPTNIPAPTQTGQPPADYFTNPAYGYGF